MKEKIKKLEYLKKKIIKETKEKVWFYSEEYEEYKKSALKYGIKGWLGTQAIFFIGSNPSKNPSKNSSSVDFFFKELKLNKFKNAHLTDLVKIRTKNTEADKIIEKNLKKQKRYLDEEIEILKPKMIVVMGRRCKKFIEGLRYKNCHFIIHYIIHYSANRFPNYKKKFIKEMRDVKKKYEGL